METVGDSLHGMYRDILKGKDGKNIYDSGWVSNTIVDRCRILLAGFMRNDQSDGIQFLAVGQGLKEWDTQQEAPDPQLVKTTDLVTPFVLPINVSALKIVYLDSDDAEITEPSNRIQITATLEPGYPTPLAPLTTYPLREFGLFGNFNNENYLINYIRHPVIHKDESANLIRTIKLYF